ncbi:MAG: hydrogenase maturation nickel metallochaperone HypA [Planctomycetes bacterium]|nr:hydrogenase maturation nickel metallochaperone HypA [Planctomycetota bacterium]
MGQSSIPIIASLLLGLVTLVLASGGLIWIWVRVAQSGRRRRPGCGQCGYDVALLETMTCPECGSDFRAVGITRSAPAGVRPWVFVALWTLLLPIPARSITSLVMGFAPLYVTTGYMIDLAPHSGVAPTVSLSLTTTYRMQGKTGRPGLPGVSTIGRGTAERPMATLTLPPVGAAGGATEPVTAMISSTTRMRELGEGPYDAATIRAYLGTLGATTSDEELTADAEELAALLNAWRATGTFTTTRFGFTGGRGIGPFGPMPATWYAPALLAGWLLVYVAGIVVFVAVHRRRVARQDYGTR